MEEESVLLEMENGIAVVTLNRPKVLNALTVEMLKRLDGIIRMLDEDKKCKVIIITGNGRAFAAGADISALKEASSESAMYFSKVAKETYRDIELARPFTIAAVNGYALGGGLEMILACDMRIAAYGAKMGIPECAIGSLPGSGGTQRLPRLVGLGRAKEILATADKVEAKKASSIGLVEYAVPPEELMQFSRRLAEKICRNSTNAIYLGKKAMSMGYDMDLEKGLELETLMIGLNYGTYDQREGMRAFAEKREPRFE